MVEKEAKFHTYEIELELVPDLKKGSIFFLLAVDIGLLPSQSDIAAEQQTSHANLKQRSLTSKIYWYWPGFHLSKMWDIQRPR